MPKVREATRTTPIVGVPRNSVRLAQVPIAEGGPSHSRAGSSNPYGARLCATAKANTAVMNRHINAVTLSLVRTTKTKLRGPRDVALPPLPRGRDGRTHGIAEPNRCVRGHLPYSIPRPSLIASSTGE